jgi:ketosteroid isomerase-like protein
MRARATCVQELYAKTLRGAEDALDAVLSGRLAGKDLQSTAYVATILMRSAKQLEDAEPEPTTGAADLDAQADEIAKLRAELARRS